METWLLKNEEIHPYDILCRVQSQRVIKDQYYSLILDILIQASLQRLDNDFSQAIVTIYRTPSHRDALISNLQQTNTSDIITSYQYFRNVTELDVLMETTTNKNHNVMIMGGTVLGIAFLLFVGVLYLVVNRKWGATRNRSSKIESYPTEDEGHLPIHTSRRDSVMAHHGSNARLMDMNDVDDNATSGEISVRTFQTLEQLYSQEKIGPSFSGSFDDPLNLLNHTSSSPDEEDIEETSVVSFNMSNLSGLTDLDFTADNIKMRDRVALSSLTRPYTPTSSHVRNMTPLGPIEDVDADAVDTVQGSFMESSFSSNSSFTLPENLKSPLPLPLRTTADVVNLDHTPRRSNSRQLHEYVAPPGKLGIVIDTTQIGPVVHDVKESSPMRDVVYPGDRIIEIDGANVQEMSASEVSEVMDGKCRLMRKIVVSRGL